MKSKLIERLRPEAVACWEDIGYKTSMLLSPGQFREFCAPLYREIADCARACGVPVLTVDSDGCAMQLVPLLVECGFNSLHPFEVHGHNDLFALRERFPDAVLFGWLEKEVVNEGQEHRIEQEIRSKVPPLLISGLVLIKQHLGGFTTMFPMVGTVAAYEARNSLWTIVRRIPWVIVLMVPMMAVIRLAQPHIGLPAALAAAWPLFLVLLWLFRNRYGRGNGD
jgi:hypothetical protein